MQKRPQRLKAPHVVDDQQAALAFQLLRDLEHRVVLALEAGPLAGQRGVNPLELGDDLRLLAKRDPQDAAVAGGKHVWVVAHAQRERGLAESAGAVQHHGFAAGVLARAVENDLDDPIEFGGTVDEVCREVGGQERRSRRLTRALQHGDETLPVAIEIVGLDLLHPDRQLRAERVELGVGVRANRTPA